MQAALGPEFENPAAVITFGSGFIRYGWADEEHTRYAVPALTGRCRANPHNMPKDWVSHFAGDEAVVKAAMLVHLRPFGRGRVVNWDEAQFLLDHAIDHAFRVLPEEQPVVLAELLSMSHADRQRAAEIMFEGHTAQALHMAQDSALAMLGSGRLTGLAVSIGHGVTSAVPVYEGHALTHFAASSPLGGADIAEYLNQLLEPRGYMFSLKNREPLHGAIEAHAYVAYDTAQAAAQPVAACTFEMPLYLGAPLTLTTERYQCSEVLFRPSLIGTPDTGVAQAVQNVIHDALKKCTDAELHAAMLDNIILWGGVANLPGMGARVHKELRAVLPPEDERLRVISVPDAHELAFLGGALVATESTFAAKCIMRRDWEEAGYRAVRARCF